MNQSRPPEAVRTIIAELHRERRTMVSRRRLVELAQHCTDLAGQGAFVECGVARGGCVAMMALMAKGRSPVWGFDSFEPMPDQTDEDEAVGEEWVGWQAADLSQVEKTLAQFSIDRAGVNLVAGWFEDTLPAAAEAIGPIAVLRLDNDWYRSTKFCLETLYPQVVPGGVVILDDYYQFPGCRRATDEFRETNKITAPIIETEEGTEGFWRVDRS